MNPDPYRGVFGSDAKSYAKDVQDHIDFGTAGKVAGFISETIQVATKCHLLWGLTLINMTAIRQLISNFLFHFI